MMKRCKIWLKNQFGCMYNRGLWVLALLWMFQFRLMAQSGGGGQGGQGGQSGDNSAAFIEGIDNAADTISATFDSVCNLVLVVAAVVGAVGAARIYIKWNNGDQDVTKSIVGSGGACLFLVATSAVLRAIFL